MLANLLPGFRHTRTPLVAGTLWLLIAWFVLGEVIMPQPGEGLVERRMHELAELFGQPIILASFGLLAVLIGGLIPGMPIRAIARRLPMNQGDWKSLAVCRFLGVEPDLANLNGEFRHWLHRRASLVPEDLGWDAFSGRICPPEMQVWARDIQEHGLARIGTTRMSASEFAGDGAVTPRDWLMWGMAEASIEQELISELPVKLQVAQERLCEEYDRIRAEFECARLLVFQSLSS